MGTLDAVSMMVNTVIYMEGSNNVLVTVSEALFCALRARCID